jgi:hypothetical protein
MASELMSFTVNNRTYHVDTMPPNVAFDLNWDVAAALAPLIASGQSKAAGGTTITAILGEVTPGLGDSLREICKRAVKYVITPDNTYLRDEATFNKWFSEHPEDLMAVPVMAVREIARNFLQPALAIVTRAIGFAPPKAQESSQQKT